MITTFSWTKKIENGSEKYTCYQDEMMGLCETKLNEKKKERSKSLS